MILGGVIVVMAIVPPKIIGRFAPLTSTGQPAAACTTSLNASSITASLTPRRFKLAINALTVSPSNRSKSARNP
jgi:hypothetical protein